jgi:hypothetical protein
MSRNPPTMAANPETTAVSAPMNSCGISNATVTVTSRPSVPSARISTTRQSPSVDGQIISWEPLPWMLATHSPAGAGGGNGLGVPGPASCFGVKGSEVTRTTSCAVPSRKSATSSAGPTPANTAAPSWPVTVRCTVGPTNRNSSFVTTAAAVSVLIRVGSDRTVSSGPTYAATAAPTSAISSPSPTARPPAIFRARRIAAMSPGGFRIVTEA